jgi:hypothetical protein
MQPFPYAIRQVTWLLGSCLIARCSATCRLPFPDSTKALSNFPSRILPPVTGEVNIWEVPLLD